jgi:hypothetical protein
VHDFLLGYSDESRRRSFADWTKIGNLGRNSYKSTSLTNIKVVPLKQRIALLLVTCKERFMD